MPTGWRNVSLLLIATLLAALVLTALPAAATQTARVALAPQADACPELVINGGFESDGSWTFGASPVPPEIVNYTSRTGARSLRLGITSGANVTSFSSARQTVSIPASATTTILSFWHYSIAEAPAGLDYMEMVLLSPDGTTVWAKPWRWTTDARVWNLAQYDLSAWRGQTFQIYFNVYNDGVGGRAAMFLDDVSLSSCGASGTPAPTWSPTVTVPAPTQTPTPTAAPCIDLIRNGAFNEALAYWETVDAPGASIAIDRFVSPPYSLKLGDLNAAINGFQTARQQVTIPVGYPNVTLDVSIFTQSQPGAGADFQEIRLLNSMGVSLFAPFPPTQANDNAWRRYQFDVSAFAGQTVFLRFGVNNDGVGGRTTMYVDDVRMTACGSGPAPTPWPTPAPTWTPWPTPWPTAWPTSWPTAWPTPWPTPWPTTWPPFPTPSPAGCIDLLQNGSFDLGLAGWTAGNNPLPPNAVSAPSLSPPYAAEMGSTTRNLNSFSSIRQRVTVPPGYDRTIIGFWEYTWAESLAGNDRQQFVLLGPGDVVWATPWKVLESSEGWRQHLYELIGAPSATFDVYFAAINDGKGGRTALYVDDVRVWACSGGALPAMETMGAAPLSEPATTEVIPLTPDASLLISPAIEPAAAPTFDLAAMDASGTGAGAVVVPFETPVVPESRGIAEATLAPQGTPFDLSNLPTPGWTEVAISGQPAPSPTAVGAAQMAATGTPVPPEGRAIATLAVNPDAVLTQAVGVVEAVAPSPTRLPFGLLSGISERTAQWPIPWYWVLLIIVVVVIGLIWLIRRSSRGNYYTP